MSLRPSFPPVAALLCLLLGAARAAAGDAAAEALVLQWVKTVQDREEIATYRCARSEALEWLSRDGTVREREVKEFACRYSPSGPEAVLLRVNGRAATPKEVKREKERESGHREHSKGGRRRHRDDNDWVNEKLARRFDYFSEGAEAVGGRRAVVIRFEPKEGLPAGKIEERALSEMHGRLWIDEGELELVRLEAGLRRPVALAGGWVGKLDRLDAVLNQRRSADGVWTPSQLSLEIEGRKLWSPFHLRDHIEQRDIVIEGGGGEGAKPAATDAAPAR